MRQEKVTLTKAELKVLVVEKILDERITNAKGVLIIGISEASDQQLENYMAEEAKAFAHRNCGKMSKHALSEEIK